jgi:hypothetical protein
MQSRRAFIGSAAAASAGAVGLAVSNQSFAPVVRAQTTDDPIVTELERQLSEATHKLLDRPSESLRTIASAVRLGAIHYRSKGVDQAVDRALRRMIQERGRDALLTLSPSAEELNAIARNAGLSSFPPTAFDYAARSAGLDAVLKVGLTARLTQMAAAFEEQSRGIDARLGPVRRIAYDAQMCGILQNQMQQTQIYMAIFCAANSALLEMGLWVAAPTCVFYTSYAAGLAVQIALFC